LSADAIFVENSSALFLNENSDEGLGYFLIFWMKFCYQ